VGRPGRALPCRWWCGVVPLALCLMGVGSGGVGGRPAASKEAGGREVLVTFEEQVQDGAPVEEVPFYRLLARVSELPQGAWRKAAPRVTADELERSPHRFRGRMVEMVGAVLETAAWELPGNPSGVETVFLVHLVDPADRLVTVAVFEEPVGWGRGDGALVRGVFFKVWRYESKGGGWEQAPLLVARRLLPAPSGAVGGKVGGGPLALAAAVGMALVVFVALRLWLGWSRRRVRFRLPSQRDDDGRRAGPRRVG